LLGKPIPLSTLKNQRFFREPALALFGEPIPLAPFLFFSSPSPFLERGIKVEDSSRGEVNNLFKRLDLD